MRGNIFPVTFLFLSCPLQKGLGYKLYPHEKESGSENTSQRFSKAKHSWLQGQAAGGQESTYKNVLKIRVKKIVLRFNTPISSLFYTLTPQKRGHLGGTRRQAGAALLLAWRALKALRAGLLLPHFFFFLSVWKKHYSIFTSKSWLVWFVSLEPSIKEATFSCYFHSHLSIRAAISFDSSAARRLTWPNGLRNACIRAV